ncbi:16481_t:CDS:2, partial [Dentiscutata heterogama]
QYPTPNKGDSLAPSLKAYDIIHYGTFTGTGASSIYGIWSIINTSIERSKLDKLDKKVEKLGEKIEKLGERVEKL